MTVYVDNAFIPYRGSRYCHLIADTPPELQEIAERIGMKAEWLQSGGTWKEHYDVGPERRRRAIAAGAVEVSQREVARMMAVRRSKEKP